MEPVVIVLEVEASLAWVRVSRLALLRLQTFIDSGYAVRANGNLFMLEMLTHLRRNALAKPPAAGETFAELRSIIRANMEHEED
jgi:hypothetical protein